MGKIFSDLISVGFILLMVLVLISGISVLLGFEKPENIEGGDPHDLTGYAYGNWVATLLSIGIFSVFVLSFLTPLKKQNWKTLGIYEAFIIAMFSEMYGFSLTIYVLSSLFGLTLSFGHAQGHLLGVLLSKAGVMSMEAGWAFVMVTSSAVIFFGLFLMSKGWSSIHSSNGELVTDGIYRYVRHPQYLGLIVITVGLLIQWPTIITVAMWPVLVVMYYRLSKKEEKEAIEAFGERYEEYKRNTPRFLPALRFGMLTHLYDPVMKVTVPENKIKNSLVQQANIDKDKRILDLGCGTATLTILIKKLHPDAEVIGLDGDPNILEIARSKVSASGFDIALDTGMAFELPYPDQNFDRVISSLMLHHLTRENKKRTFKEVFRILRPGGELHVADFGKPQNFIMYIISLIMRRLEETEDNINGLLPEMFHDAGFVQINETARYMSVFGTISLYRAVKPE